MSAVFVDTNVLVYARDGSERRKQPRAAEWLLRLWQERRGRLSTQVLQEYYVVVTSQLKPGLAPASAREDVRLLQAWQPVAPDLALLESAWDVQDRYRLSFWDAQVVAAAERCGAAYLLTEDLQDGQELGGVRVVNPFVHEPASLD
ncbi:MAG: PIN domain-containing protein [Gemmatimonadetes bacterium]|nr:PIN domain-containing protein [Gemmatimonadota bacterium]